MPRLKTLSRSTMLRAAGAVAALAVTVPAGGASAVERPIPTIACAGAGMALGAGEWQTFRAPGFDAPLGVDVSQEIVAYAVGPKAASNGANLIVVTNGNSIEVSRNGGCNWDTGLLLDRVPADPQRMPLSGLVTRIRDLYISPNGTVYATAEELETGAAVGRPHVLISTEGGRRNSWTLGDSGLPPVGTPLRLRAARNSRVMYLSFGSARQEGEGGGTPCPPAPLPCPDPGTEEQGPPGLLWGSADGGRTWSARTDPGDLNSAATIKHFSIEDDDPSGNTLWVVANGRLRKSTNGGRSFSVPDGLDQSDFQFTAVESIDEGENEPNSLKLVAFSSTGEMIRLQVGKGWVRSKVPFGPVESVAQRAEGDIAVVTSGERSVWRIYAKDFLDYDEKVGLGGIKFVRTYGWESISPQSRPTVDARVASGDAATAAGSGTYFLRDRKRILRFLRSAARGGNTSAPPQIVGAPPPPRGQLSPAVITRDVPLGKTLDVKYTLTLPPAPTPLDLYLLVDNSGSMQPLIEDLKRSLGDVAVALVRSGVDVHIGVGQINVQPDADQLPIDDPRTPDYDEGKPRPLYQRLRAIGPVDREVFTQLSTIDGNGGSGDEAQLEALYQSVTGKGMSPLGLGALIGYQVPPDQEAGFRGETSSIKVILHATDEGFSTNIRNGHNDPAPVAAALRKAGVKQIGLSQGVKEAHDDLSAMAAATGAVAPSGGVDCDGDGRPNDIQPGDPLVCKQNYGLDRTLLNLLGSLSDRAVINIDAKPGPTLASVSRTEFPIDAKKTTTRTFTVRYSCVNVPIGTYENTIGASLRGLSIATAVATINCGGPPALRGTNPQVAGEPAGSPPLPQPNPPIPAPAPLNPISQPQTQVQTQTQVNPQAGAADQEQEELQVATATNTLEGGRQDEDQLAMSMLGYEDTAPAPYYVTLAGMGLATACATAVALRRRTRTQVARQRIR